MDCLIEVLVEAMNTVDGQKDTAEIIYSYIEREKYRQLFKSRRKKKRMNEEFENIDLTKK